MFDFIEEKFQSLTVLYYCEEPGCGIYETNDMESMFYPNDGTDLDFISQDAIDIYDEIFFFADSKTLTLEDDELIKKLITDNPDFIEWIG